MPSISSLIWLDAGSPVADASKKSSHGMCAVCGDISSGVSIDRMPDSFTAWHRLTAMNADTICHACWWLMQGRPPDTFRMFSTMYRADMDFGSTRTLPSKEPNAKTPVIGPHTWAGNKADMSVVRATLLSPPESIYAVALADSGQVHTIPFAPACKGQHWAISADKGLVYGNATAFRKVMYHAISLWASGFSPDEVKTLSPLPYKLVDVDKRSVWSEHSQFLKPRDPLIEIAFFVTKKDEVFDVIAHTAELLGIVHGTPGLESSGHHDGTCRNGAGNLPCSVLGDTRAGRRSGSDTRTSTESGSVTDADTSVSNLTYYAGETADSSSRADQAAGHMDQNRERSDSGITVSQRPRPVSHAGHAKTPARKHAVTDTRQLVLFG